MAQELKKVFKKLMRTTTVLGLIVGTPAFAGPANGLYAGGQIGYLFDAEATTTIPAYTAVPFSYNLDGVQGGVFLGYNFVSPGGIVFGAELGANFMTASGSHLTNSGPESFSSELDWESSLVGRVGGLAGDYFVYGLAGISRLQATGEYSTTSTTATDSQWGYVVGVGVERDIPSGGFIRGEVRYADYEQFDFQCSICGGPTFGDISTVSLTLGVGINF